MGVISLPHPWHLSCRREVDPHAVELASTTDAVAPSDPVAPSDAVAPSDTSDTVEPSDTVDPVAPSDPVELALEKGTEMASFSAEIAPRFTGNNPHALNPFLRCSGLKASVQSSLIRPVII